MGMSTKKWFTLVELIIAIALFGIGLIAVFVVLVNGFKTMNQARGQVIAINLAREWAEMMFNVRDTNLLKRAGKRDQCRLIALWWYSADPEKCEEATWLGFFSWLPAASYIPMTAPLGGTGKVPVMFGMWSGTLNIFDGITAADTGFELMLTSSGEFLPYYHFLGSNGTNGCKPLGTTWRVAPTTTWCLPVKYSPAGRFFRIIKNVELRDKNPAITWWRLLIGCKSWVETDTTTWIPCGTSLAKELRFCSEVQYLVENARRTVSICSVMTNFKE